MHNLARPHLQLSHLLSPQGIKTVTTGGDEVGRFLSRQFGSVDIEVAREVWLEQLARIEEANLILLGVPSDAGAGFERGSFKGPLGVRSAMLDIPGLKEAFQDHGVVDVGDIRVNPHLVAEDMISAKVRDEVRRDRGWQELADLDMPVTPHGALERALELILVINPGARVLMLGGDHSLSQVPVRVLTRGDRAAKKDLGIVHFDAHTDLLSIRDGVDTNFATWAYHANDMVGRGRRLQQLGIRVSGYDRAHWERALDVRQHWSHSTREDPDGIAAAVIDELTEVGVERVYISNDIDGTDPTYAASTGTMEPGGMMPEFVLDVIARVGANFDVIGSDLVEVAPPLKWHIPGEPVRTIEMAACYTIAQLEAMLGESLSLEAPIPKPATEAQVLATPW